MKIFYNPFFHVGFVVLITLILLALTKVCFADTVSCHYPDGLKNYVGTVHDIAINSFSIDLKHDGDFLGTGEIILSYVNCEIVFDDDK